MQNKQHFTHTHTTQYAWLPWIRTLAKVICLYLGPPASFCGQSAYPWQPCSLFTGPPLGTSPLSRLPVRAEGGSHYHTVMTEKRDMDNNRNPFHEVVEMYNMVRSYLYKGTGIISSMDLSNHVRNMTIRDGDSLEYHDGVRCVLRPYMMWMALR